jgi:hypothetical protein
MTDGFTTSSNEQLRSLDCVYELDEITSNCGKDRSVTKEHPRGLKRKRLDFVQEEPPSWTQGWHRQIVQMERAKCINTRPPTGAKVRPNRAEMGLGRSAQASRTGPLRGSVRPPPPPLFLAPEDPLTPSSWRHCHSQDREPIAPRGYPHARERGGRSFGRRITQLEGITHKWRRRKTPLEVSPWSMVPCLAPWWGNIFICPWVVIDLEM